MIDVIKKTFSKKYLQSLDTPVFLYLHSQTKQNIEDFKIFAKNDIEILYAIKSSNHPKLIKAFIKEGYGFEVATVEELKFLIEKGADPKRISFSSTSKLVKDLKWASKVGVPYYAFDSEEEIKKIVKNVKNPILVARISTPSKESAFDLSSKYGMDDKYYEYILKQAVKNNWPIKGLTFHVGSQNPDLKAWKNSLAKMEYLIDMTKSFGLEVDYLNLGGGIPVPYENGIKHVSYYNEGICKLVKNLRKKYTFKKVFIEPGRALSANTAIMVAEVTDIKPYKKPPLVALDTSVFGGLIEPLEHFEYPLYGLEQIYGKNEKTTLQYFKVGGYSCDGYDIIHRYVALPKNVAVGDKIIVSYAGAYTFVFVGFHMKPYPNILDF